MFSKHLLSILFIFWICVSWSQTKTIKGIIIDDETQEALIGAGVVEKGTDNGTTTDLEGKFSLNISTENPTLIFSYVGYVSQEIKISDHSDLMIKLKQGSSVLNEVVVTALNLKRETKALGYAVQKLESEEIATVKSPNFVDNLTGKIAGVNISRGATGVGSSSKITIRGEASFTNNNPLFVVDGTPIDNSTIINSTNEAAAGFQEVDFGNRGMEINPDDIESVTVLKGPNAAALYGARASNGVIIITTKKGKENNGLGISFNSSTFLEKPFRLPRFQNKYGQGNSGQFEFVDGLGGGTNDNITYSWGPVLDQGLNIAQFDSPVAFNGGTVRGGDVAVHGGAEINPSPFISHPDNLKNFYRTGITTINNISLSSGYEKGNYRFSLSDLRSQSPIPGVNLERNTISGNWIFNPIKKLNITSSIHYMNSRSDNRPSGGYGSENINYSLVAWGPRSMDIQNLKDYWQPGLEEIQQFSFNYTFFDNPYFILLENRNSFNRDRILGNISATYHFTDQLSLNVMTGMDYSDELRKLRRHYSTNRFKNGAYAEQDVFFREINTSFLLNYNKGFGNFNFDFSIGGNRMNQETNSQQTEALALAQPGIFNFSNAAIPLNVNQFEAKKRINSLYALAKLNFKDIVYLDITGRNDWSSALATPTSTENTSFFYSSISTGIIISNMTDLPEWISFAKIRGGWAQVGNDTDPFQTTGAFVAGIPFNSQPTFTTQNEIANAGLLPEKTTSLELGTDLRFLDDRLKLDITYYNALTKNQIISLPVPISSGYTSQIINGGAVRSKGWEIMLGATPVLNNNFQWNTFWNFSRNISTVEELPEGAEKITLAYSRVYDNENQTVWFQVEEGGKIGDMYGTGYLKNENGDFVIDDNGKYIVDNTLKKLGNYNSDFTLGINNEFNYKNWNFNFLLDWRQGGEIISRTLSLAAVGGQLIETEDRPEDGIIAEGVVNVGTSDNPIWEQNTTAISAESYYRQFYDRNHEENNVYDATYLKLRQLSLGYTFRPKNEKGFFQKGRTLKIAFIGRNLWAWSKIPHFDPEQLAIQGNRFISGVEDMSYPTSRSFGIQLGYDF